MKSLKTSVKDLVRQSLRLGLLLVIVAALTLEATSIIQYFFSQKSIREEATSRAESQLEVTRLKIMDVVDQTEAAVRNSVWIAQWCLDVTDSLQVVARRIVEDNPVVVGSTVALVPGYDKQHPLLAPYACREGDHIIIKSLATDEYDYPSQEWFTKPIELGEGYWSEPYVDEGGGEILMTTYSLPIQDTSGRTAAVLTADISLDWLTELVGNAQVYPNSFGVVLSRAGQIMVSPVETLTMRSSVHDFGKQMEDSKTYDSLSRSMLSGQSGNIPLRRDGITSHVFFAPVERTGWSMSIVIPDKEIYGGIRRVSLIVKILQLIGLAMLILILRAVAKSQMKYKEVSDKKERMESELQIGHNIQMAMIPNVFPPFPERKDIDMSACLVPAKEVSGDLYDFYIRDEKLYFCIGDVSGKGVPASLVMAVTRSLFRAVSAHEESPQRIVTAMNDSMSEMNESNMFVTFFCGILDLTNGHLRFCNAGHNPPLIFTNKISTLQVHPNLPLGIMQGMAYQEQETDLVYDDALFLFTDGLTEAENLEHEQFGEDRMKALLHTRRDAQGHLDAVRAAVAEFVGEAPQSDDLTMLFIHYLNPTQSNAAKRHLSLRNDIHQIPLLAEFVDAIAQEKNLNPNLTNDLNLALEEAVSNVMLYAYPEGTDGVVNVEAILDKDQLTFVLTDSGKAFDPTAAPETDIKASADDRPIGGLGIHLVRTIMDAVNYQRSDGKNILTMIKNL
jgi:sigma-B regulation protein RsbU (phosphoserine phosphatase)